MEQIIVIPETRLRELIRETIAENQFPKEPPRADIKLTSIAQLADFLGVSTVTAQKIKNSLPKEYLQVGRSFVISANWLLQEYPKMQSGKGKRAAR